MVSSNRVHTNQRSNGAGTVPGLVRLMTATRYLVPVLVQYIQHWSTSTEYPLSLPFLFRLQYVLRQRYQVTDKNCSKYHYITMSDKIDAAQKEVCVVD
jgi:hypothetical protein